MQNSCLKQRYQLNSDKSADIVDMSLKGSFLYQTFIHLVEKEVVIHNSEKKMEMAVFSFLCMLCYEKIQGGFISMHLQRKCIIVINLEDFLECEPSLLDLKCYAVALNVPN